jgi:glycosyltransferase involved in cell wall biosynthesis
VTGLLVPVDEGLLQAALAELERDRDLAKRLGMKARETALERYDYDRMVDAYMTLYATP